MKRNLFALFLIGSWACNSAEGEPESHDYIPLSIGASWTYRVVDASGEGSKTQTVQSTAMLDGIGEVFVLETTKPDGDRTVSYQQVVGTDILRYREEVYRGSVYDGREVYSPSKLRLSNAFSLPGEVRTEMYDEKTYDANDQLMQDLVKTEEWRVEAVETLTVPAGTFEGVLRVRRTSRTTASDKTYWYLDGVGKLKESGAGQTEELVSHQVP
jgi:hypothetical protein